MGLVSTKPSTQHVYRGWRSWYSPFWFLVCEDAGKCSSKNCCLYWNSPMRQFSTRTVALDTAKRFVRQKLWQSVEKIYLQNLLSWERFRSEGALWTKLSFVGDSILIWPRSMNYELVTNVNAAFSSCIAVRLNLDGNCVVGEHFLRLYIYYQFLIFPVQ